MIKKATANFFVLVAGMLLLVHAVVPHHHHQSQICFNLSHCQADAHHDDHDETGKHSHDGGNDDSCILKEPYLIPGHNTKFEPVLSSVLHYEGSALFFTLNGALHHETPLPQWISVALYESDAGLFTSPGTVNSRGLRGPPVI